MLTLDAQEFRRSAERFEKGLKQAPFAVARALNDSADAGREEIITSAWPSAVKVKNQRFISAALTTKGERATKGHLQVTLYDRIGRVPLTRLEQGGTKQARSGTIAVPTRAVRRGSNGAVVRGQKPRALDPKKVVKKGNLIFIRVGRGKHEKLKLLYKLQPSANVKAMVPFHQVFDTVVRREMRANFDRRLLEALRTAK
jgi:hypothetical protein